MEGLTKEIGLHIRDTLRSDDLFITYLFNLDPTDPNYATDLAAKKADAHNHIFFTRPTNQSEGFDNPRVVVDPTQSGSGKWGNTEIYQGPESYLISIWTEEAPYDMNMNCVDRAANIFNQEVYSFDSDFNKGTFDIIGKISFQDPDKEKTKKGDVNITLNIGGIL